MPRLAILSYSDGRFDARSRRIVRSAAEIGYASVIYARWEPGLPLEEDLGGVRVVRVPIVLRMAIPGLRRGGRRRIERIRAGATRSAATPASTPVASSPRAVRHSGPLARIRRRVGEWLIERLRQLVGPVILFPLRPLAWAAALEEVAEPADIWHGMWVGSLPALARLRTQHGGRTIYDSRDIYLHARIFDRMRPIIRDRLVWLERRWAKTADLVVTVNDHYAEILATLLRVPRPIVVRNCPDPFENPDGDRKPDHIRDSLGLPASTAVVLYQGGLMTERGIEQGMDAIEAVPGAVLVIMGFGGMLSAFKARAASSRHRERIAFLDPVPPEELLAWTASSDVMLMAIQPTTLNHRYTTPQKLWEAIAAGVPVVASDLPGMSEVIDEVGCGTTCDPTDPVAIASAIRRLISMSPTERAAMRERTLTAARGRYNWDAQATVLLAAYEQVLSD